MRIMREEIFGPVLPIVTVDSEEQALEMANDSQFGLGASIWTKDRAKGERMARRVESGMVWINDHSYSHGACQCSGRREGVRRRPHALKFGFYECVDIKLVASGARPDPGLLVAALRPHARKRRARLRTARLRAERQIRCARFERARSRLQATARTFRKGR